MKPWASMKEKMEATTRRILTLENGVLEERVNWLKERLNLKDGAIKKQD